VSSSPTILLYNLDLKLLGISIPIRCDKKINTIALDSTGLKVYGEAEWKVRQHSYSSASIKKLSLLPHQRKEKVYGKKET
jgi:hypothetical protein